MTDRRPFRLRWQYHEIVQRWHLYLDHGAYQAQLAHIELKSESPNTYSAIIYGLRRPFHGTNRRRLMGRLKQAVQRELAQVAGRKAA